MLKKLVDEALIDRSSRNVFLFRISCGNCSSEYGNRPIRFSKANIKPAAQNKQSMYDTLYRQELLAARQIAVRNAAEHMNYCPVCKRLVCNRCFLICDDLDMCRQCAAEQDLQGRPVKVGLRKLTG